MPYLEDQVLYSSEDVVNLELGILDEVPVQRQERIDDIRHTGVRLPNDHLGVDNGGEEAALLHIESRAVGQGSVAAEDSIIVRVQSQFSGVIYELKFVFSLVRYCFVKFS